MHASYTILWLLLCVHESQYVEQAEDDYTDCNTKENEIYNINYGYCYVYTNRSM